METIKINEILKQIELKIKDNLNRIDNVSFDIGLSGIALFYYYYYLFTGNNNYINNVYEIVDLVIKKLSSIEEENFEKKYYSDSFDNQISGFGKLLVFLKTKVDTELDVEALLNEIDDTLAFLMTTKLENHDYDLNSGALASGYYFLSRYKQTKLPMFKKYLLDIIQSISENYIESENGIYWLAPSLHNQAFLGLSHGSSMIINFLSKMIDNNITDKILIVDIIKKGITFIQSNERDQVQGRFPHCYYEDEPEEIEKTQFSQCYGDLGIGYAIIKAGKSIDDIEIFNYGQKILEECVTRKIEDKMTLDAGIVYGASGVACVFDEIYTLTGNSIFEKASDYWFKKILFYLKKGQDDDLSFESAFISPKDILWNISFGWGGAGIGTSLIRSIDKIKYPSFNEFLMVGS